MDSGASLDGHEVATAPDVRKLVASAIDEGSDGPFLAFQDRWYNWCWLKQFRAALDGYAVAAGVEPGNALALVARNRPDHVAVMAAQTASNRLTAMVYSAQSPAGIAAEVERVGAPLVVADRQDWTSELIGVADRMGSMGLALGDGTEEPAIVVEAQRGGNRGRFIKRAPDIGFEMLSSGTTGTPKRIPLSWSTLSSATDDAGSAYAGTVGSQAPQIMLHPLGNIAGVSYILPILAFRQRVVLMEKFDLAEWVKVVKTYRPKRAALPPAGIGMVLGAEVTTEDLSSLAVIGVGGGKLDPQLQEEFEQRFSIPLLPAFGATEFAGVIANWSLEDYRAFGKAKRGSAGRASRNVALRIVDRNSFEPLPAGQVGLLEARVSRLGPDWIRTNDLASIDDDGFLFIHGRADDAINRGGFKIVPDTVVAALKRHPAVADAAVVGIADDRLGEVPVAAVELRPAREASPEALKAYLRDQLVAYQVPTEIRIMPELPRNPSMKIALQEVRSMFISKGGLA